MTADDQRLQALDALRGVAVMGILLMNIVGFALPDAAYLNPDATGASSADRWIWTVQFVLVDGKMRGLFALLFGIGILLAADAADARGQDAATAHLRRMTALLLLGLVHFYGFWTGDILTDYALVGLLAFLWRPASPIVLVASALAMFATALLIQGQFVADLATIRAAATAPGADAAARSLWGLHDAWLGWPTAAERAAEVATHGLAWPAALLGRLRDYGGAAITGDLGSRLEVLGLMLTGMAVHRSGLIAHPRAWRLGAAAVGAGLPWSIVLAWPCWQGGFDPVGTAAVVFAWSLPPRVLLTLGWLGLLAGWASTSRSALARRVRAAGRMALSNYLGATLLFTALFDGWGFGLYGTLTRAQLLPLVVAAWTLMLLWSPAWLSRLRFGPAEWLWRSLAAGRLLPLTRKKLAIVSQ